MTNMPKTLTNMPIQEDEDLDFIPIRAAAKRRKAGIFSHILLIIIAVFFIFFLIWGNFAKLDEVTRGIGKVIPSSRIQLIDNLEGGIISELYIQDGDLVKKGQILLKINNVLAEADLLDIQKRIISLRLKKLRLKAELDDTSLEFPKALVKQNQATAKAEKSSFLLNSNKIQQQLDVLHEQTKQRAQEIKELQREIEHLKKTEQLAKQQIEMTRPLAKTGAISKIELIQRERDYNDIKSQLDTTKLSLPRIKGALKEAEARIEEQMANYKDQVSRELADARLELQSLNEKVRANQDRVSRTEVRSPVNGIVKQLLVNTIGGVVQPGEDLVEIVPIDDNLKIEAEIKPSDIAFLSPGLKATIKITAYDFSIYGGLEGKVVDISADTILDKKGNEFYHVRLVTDKNYLTRNGKKLPIIPGMTASVNILTGKKSVLDYLLKPILKAKNNALTER